MPKPRKILFVGDPHITPSNIVDAEKLLTFVEQTAIGEKADQIVFLGDLFHTKEIIRGSVLVFWDNWLKKLSSHTKTIALCGNHDQFYLGNNRDHSLAPLTGTGATIVSDFYEYDGMLFVAYEHDKAKFVVKANQDVKVVVCHQTFDGSRFENSFFAPDGIDQNLISPPLIISGHIHARQTIGKVVYPGTPMWHTASDANQEKGLWLAEFDANLALTNSRFIDTSPVVTPIRSYTIREGDAIPVLGAGKNFLVLEGPSEWIKEKSKELKGVAHIQGKPTDSKMRKKATGVKNKTIECFMDSFKISDKIKKEDVLAFLKEIQNV